MKNYWVVIISTLALAACDNSTTNTAANNTAGASDNAQETTVDISSNLLDNSVEEPTKPIHGPEEIRASASIADGEPAQAIYLVPVGDISKRDQLAGMMRQSGFECNLVSSAYQLRQDNGDFVGVFKIDCDTGNFQATILNDKVFIKRWTGNILGH